MGNYKRGKALLFVNKSSKKNFANFRPCWFRRHGPRVTKVFAALFSKSACFLLWPPASTGGQSRKLLHRRLQVGVELVQKVLGVQPGRVLGDQHRQVLGHE